MALIIVLPLFFLCYGGSCLYYIIYKIYRYCRSSSHKKEQSFNTTKYSQPPPAHQQPQQVLMPIHVNGPPANSTTSADGFPMYYARGAPPGPTAAGSGTSYDRKMAAAGLAMSHQMVSKAPPSYNGGQPPRMTVAGSVWVDRG